MSVNNTNRSNLIDYILGQGSSSTQGKNYITNSFARDSIVPVVVTGTATVARNTTTPLTGISDFLITLPSNTTDSVEWPVNTLDNSLKNQNCQLTFDYKIGSIGSVVQAQVLIGGVLTVSQTLPSTPTQTTLSLNVPCGDLSGSTFVRISNAAGNTGTSSINVANMNYGKATNVSAAGILTPWTTYSLTIGAVTTPPTLGTNTQSAQWRRVGDSMELMYTLAQTSAGTAGSGDYLFPLPSGYTMDTTKVTVSTTANGASGTVVGNGQIANTTTTSATGDASTIIPYNTTNLRIIDNNNGANQMSGVGSGRIALSGATVYYSYHATVPISGWSTGSAVSADQTDYDWTAYTPTFTGFGTVTGIQCEHARVDSDLKLRCNFVSGTPTAVEARLSLPTGLTSADTTKIPAIQLAGTNIYSQVAATNGAILIEPSVTYVTFGQQSGSFGGLTKLTGTNALGAGNTMSLTASIPIQGWTANQRAPTLIGSVTSNSTSAERIERISFNGGNFSTVCSTSPCTIASQSGSWISSVTRTALGAYTLNVVTAFGAPPTCTCRAAAPGTGNAICTMGAAANTTTSVFVGGGTLIASLDIISEVICVGPR